MPRLLSVKGVPDRLVTNPHVERSIRFVGKQWDESSDASLPHASRWKDVEATLEDHADLRAAVKKGDLLACDEATAKRCGLAPKKAEKPKESK
jgi:DNA-binding GntR family transcriptional regulator